MNHKKDDKRADEIASCWLNPAEYFVAFEDERAVELTGENGEAFTLHEGEAK